MARTKITDKIHYKVAKDIADLQQYQRESNGNQSTTYIFVNVTIDGSSTIGKIIFGSDTKGNILSSSVYLQPRTGGGLDFYNGSGTKIASLDINGNLICKGSITPNGTP